MLALFLAGCGDLTNGEISQVLDDSTRVLADVEARLNSIETLVQPATPASTLRHGQGDGDYVFEGTYDADDVGWASGTVAVCGSGTSRQQGAIQFETLDLVWDGVVVHETTYDGETTAAIGVSIVPGGEGSPSVITVSYDVTGGLDASGPVTGHADMDWTMNASTAEGGDHLYDGTINGKDVGRIKK
jgi:hypothetical protein